MKKEALEAHEVVALQINENKALISNITQEILKLDPYSIITCARGSSNHACQYFSYLTMAKLGILPTSLSLSILTLLKAKLHTNQSIGISISQSGQSPDIVKPIEFLTTNALGTVSFVNDTTSPLAQASKWVVPLHAKKEEAVAATKSFISSLSASAHFIASWSQDTALLNGLDKLSENLQIAQKQDWTAATESLINAKRIMTVGRGYGLSIASEAALKLKETCSIQAEAFSAAEIKHGPQALIEDGYPLLIFATEGPTLLNLLDLAQDMKQRGANVILAAPEFVKEKNLTIHSTGHAELDVISAIQSFYLLAESLSLAKGLNPDTPKHLAKVTKTN